MNRPKAIVAEDEGPLRQELVGLLTGLWPELEVVAECSDGLAALEALETLHPDVAFLDIRMPGVSGLEVARAAVGAQCQVVFTTAYEEYAVRAFDASAVDYLLKPISRDRLSRSLERVRERIGSGGISADVASLITKLQSHLPRPAPQGIKWITASAGNTVKMHLVDEVLFFQAQAKYTRVVTGSEEGYIRASLKELLGSLDPEAFWQVHRSVIVRVGAIRAVERDDEGKLNLTIRGRPDVLPVSSALQYRFRGM